ncbi:putative molybdenum cofactor biosynthesis protein Gephyrin [Cladophialophora carrionii]|uniref:Putative molybdenum cofactor biosynthesis protein Gephyrin n=1 Tax=Cladophialophora carrionii TaxID=86049 RepID=A0A1C1C7A3_9EURO|nr:putative molybdenum cofactor biosynthesis protein Gephyrin [Cladophialophora carrionii]
MALLRPAILVISDTAASDPSTDKAIPTLSDVLAHDGAGKWTEPLTAIVKDDVVEIQRAVRAWTDTESNNSSGGGGGGGVVNLVITTGGTGFARRDFTPEAIAPLLHRQAPGIVHAMLAASFQVTPFAMMARPVAGVRNQSIVITLPGSPKGAKENLQAVVKLLPHACFQAAGEDSRVAHIGGVKKLEREAGVVSPSANSAPPGKSSMDNHSHSHSHSHQHDHSHEHNHSHGHRVPKAHTTPAERPQLQSNDPRLGASQRYRSSPYPMLSVSEAVSVILQNTPPPTVEVRDLSPDLVGYVVAEDIYAKEAVPAYRASLVDGYAVIVPDKSSADVSGKQSGPGTGIKGTFPVASVSHAQATSLPPPLQPGQIARITTGAPLPENANAVVMVEDTVIATLSPDGLEEQTVEILTDKIVPGENIREPGSDVQLNDLVLAKGTQLTPLGGEIGVLAASGTRHVPVYRKPRVGVLSTGDEVTDITHPGPLTGGMIRDSNRPALLSLIRGWNLCEEVVDLHVARDTPAQELELKLRDAFRLHGVDVVVTTGGVSMGELDLLKPTIERALGGTVHFGRVSMKPGKPTTFASVSIKDKGKDKDVTLRSSASATTDTNADSSEPPSEPPSDTRHGRRRRLIFGLPGNPASALVTANLFLLPCLQKLVGVPAPTGLPRVKVRLQGRLRCDAARTEYHRAVVAVDPSSSSSDGRLVARSTGMQRSSRVGSVASANALLVMPAKDGFVDEGAECEALMMGLVRGY